MAATVRLNAGCGLSVIALLFLPGCGKRASQETALQLAPHVAELADTPRPVGDEKVERVASRFAESELDHVPGDIVARCEIPPANIQSQRILTAGSLNDVKDDHEFRNYVAEVRRTGSSVLSPSMSEWDGRRIEIMVRNSDGKPVSDAIVRVFRTANSQDDIQLKYQPNVKATGSDAIIALLRTGSDGRTHFLPALDGDRHYDSWDVEILNPGGELCVRQEDIKEPAALWDFAIGHEPSTMPQQLDLALAIDTTGSMGDELEYLKLEISNIAARVERLFPGIDQRFALILYRDSGDRYVTRSFDFTDSLTNFQQELNDQHASGGGDYPEAMHAALEQAGELSWRSRNTARVMFLVSDAPPHNRHMARTFDAVQRLRKHEITIFPVAGSGTRDEAEFALRTMAFMTMGQYLFLTDHSGVGLPHAAPHASEYNVEWLNAVMLRMIVSELSGRDVLPSEILATEETGGHVVAQSAQHHPNAYLHQAEQPMPTPFLNAAIWSELRPQVALALLLFLAMAERYFARRPARQTDL